MRRPLLEISGGPPEVAAGHMHRSDNVTLTVLRRKTQGKTRGRPPTLTHTEQESHVPQTSDNAF